RGAGGTTTAQMATLEAVSLGGATTRNVRAMVADALGPPIDGILGINVLVGFELDLDVPQRRLVLYRARPCAAALPPWSGPYTRLPVQQQRTGHLFVSAELDGQPVFGLLDTGASRTTMAVAVARDAGVTLRQLQAAPGGRSRTLDPGGLAFRQQQFRALRIGNDVLESPMLLVADLPPYAGEMIIGGDYLATRRVWMSLLTGMVFTTASAQPADQPRPR
ncbi:MAG: clan AA aspartic protease, partial [Gemmatimonadaceae bacterium]|nr:clan AA aspartic protease [Acetobacteraceae bacterium]